MALAAALSKATPAARRAFEKVEAPKEAEASGETTRRSTLDAALARTATFIPRVALWPALKSRGGFLQFSSTLIP